MTRLDTITNSNNKYKKPEFRRDRGRESERDREFTNTKIEGETNQLQPNYHGFAVLYVYFSVPKSCQKNVIHKILKKYPRTLIRL